mmetsp:Transcript_9043/g.14070  ORF Transcript_9043/g.14070 Transcript_9043/m.14070 type:complete len:249 (-) Transcript_9043:437-1183(-)
MPVTTIETFGLERCYLLRGVLNSSEQLAVFGDILNRSAKNNVATACMYPTPKTLLFKTDDDPSPTLHFDEQNSNNIYNEMIIRKTNAILRCQPSQTIDDNDNTHNWLLANKNDENNIVKCGISVIRYPAPTGKFPEHVDHCNDGSCVYLLSLGCTAKFSVATTKTNKTVFEFQSGDVLVFDPSTEASISHGVPSIVESTYHPIDELLEFSKDDQETTASFDSLRNYRYGVQCRVKQKNTQIDERRLES